MVLLQARLKSHYLVVLVYELFFCWFMPNNLVCKLIEIFFEQLGIPLDGNMTAFKKLYNILFWIWWNDTATTSLGPVAQAASEPCSVNHLQYERLERPSCLKLLLPVVFHPPEMLSRLQELALLVENRLSHRPNFFINAPSRWHDRKIENNWLWNHLGTKLAK